VPLAKRAKYLETGPDAALQQQQQQPPMSPEQQAVQQLGLMEAAEAGVLRVRVARQGSSGGSSNIAAKPPATAGSGRPQQKEAAAAAGGVGCKRQAGKVAAAAAPRQKRAAAAAASKAWGGAPRNFASSSNASSSSSRAKAACGVKLVPKPADPSQLVPAPTKAELASGNGGSSYEVEAILAHRVSSSSEVNSAVQALIRWPAVRMLHAVQCRAQSWCSCEHQLQVPAPSPAPSALIPSEPRNKPNSAPSMRLMGSPNCTVCDHPVGFRPPP
jgi:hypothetical protein